MPRLRHAELGAEPLADSYIEIQQFRLLILHTAWLIDQSSTREARTQIAACKVAAARVFHDVVYRAMHIHGAASPRRRSSGVRRWSALTPTVGFSPTFLMPAHAGTVDQIVETVRATPRSAVRAEMASIAEKQPVPSWAHQLADDPHLYQQVSDGVGSLYSLLLEPYWQSITDLFAADRSVRMRQLLTGGIESLLSQANPQWLRWEPPILELQMPNRIDHDLFLEGQGILLVPSLFRAHSMVDSDTLPQPLVSYPAGLNRQG